MVAVSSENKKNSMPAVNVQRDAVNTFAAGFVGSWGSTRLYSSGKSGSSPNSAISPVAVLSFYNNPNGIGYSIAHHKGYWELAYEAQRNIDRSVSAISDLLYQDDSTIEKCNNIRLLDEIQESRDEGEEDYVSDKVLTNARGIVANLYEQPMIFRTHRNSIQFEYEMESGSYLEFEIFEERVTCMWIPKGDVKRASFPEVGLNDYNAMNRIVEVFIEDE